MSFCQPDNASFSCGACCGFLNLKISKEELQALLERRTEDFLQKVDFEKIHTIAAFRQLSEAKESKLEKYDTTTYNCPFLGYIDSEYKKIGCMIHPAKTNDPKSQNFSFYGTSICQAYDCKNKERSSAMNWESFLSENDYNSIEYSAIVSDHISLGLIENFFSESGIAPELEIFKQYPGLLKKIIRHKLDTSNNPTLQHLTSFEINYSNSTKDSFHALCERLSIMQNSELFLELQDLSNNSISQHS